MTATASTGARAAAHALHASCCSVIRSVSARPAMSTPACTVSTTGRSKSVPSSDADPASASIGMSGVARTVRPEVRTAPGIVSEIVSGAAISYAASCGKPIRTVTSSIAYTSHAAANAAPARAFQPPASVCGDEKPATRATAAASGSAGSFHVSFTSVTYTYDSAAADRTKRSSPLAISSSEPESEAATESSVAETRSGGVPTRAVAREVSVSAGAYATIVSGKRIE